MPPGSPTLWTLPFPSSLLDRYGRRRFPLYPHPSWLLHSWWDQNFQSHALTTKSHWLPKQILSQGISLPAKSVLAQGNRSFRRWLLQICIKWYKKQSCWWLQEFKKNFQFTFNPEWKISNTLLDIGRSLRPSEWRIHTCYKYKNSVTTIHATYLKLFGTWTDPISTICCTGVQGIFASPCTAPSTGSAFTGTSQSLLKETGIR